MKTRTTRAFEALTAIGLACAATLIGWAPAEAQVDFAGKRIEMIIPFSEGGGTDTWARMVAPFLAKHLPGKPTLVLRNVPGGGSITGANSFEKNAKPDGRTIMALSTSLSLSYVLNPTDPRVQFKAEKWIPFFSSPAGSMVYANTAIGITDAATLKDVAAKRDIRIGVSNATGSDIRTLLSFNMIGIDIKPVFGLDGGKAQLAFERGEVHVGRDTSGGYLLLMKPLVDQGKAAPLFTMGFLDDNGKVVRDPTFPDIPDFLELYRKVTGKEPSGPELDAWMAFFHIGVMNSKQMVLPAGTPADIVAAYDQAAQAMVADPEFQAAAQAEIGVYKQLIGDKARQSLAAALTMKPETRKWVVDWLKAKYNADL
jgi:tripartite-type tricarboxylate transporter receptor subunit TctC